MIRRNFRFRSRLVGSARFALAVLFCFWAGMASAQELLSQGTPVKIRTKPIETFKIGQSETRFGKLTFLGGLELLGPNGQIGGLSGLVMLDRGNRFLAVTDNGHWVAGDIRQSAKGAPLDVADVRFAPLLGTDGKTLRARWGHDTEAVTLYGSGLYVAAERKNAIYHYPWPLSTGKERMIGQLGLPKEVRILPRNKGLESLADAPRGSRLAGSLVAVAESSASGSHNLKAYIIGPKGTVRFDIVRKDGFDATDAAFLPNGDLLLLERRFNLRNLIGMRLRRLPGAALKSGAVVDGNLLLEADFGHQIDNMEALAVHTGSSGETILTLLSDNNRSLLQRTLLLRFRLDE